MKTWKSNALSGFDRFAPVRPCEAVIVTVGVCVMLATILGVAVPVPVPDWLLVEATLTDWEKDCDGVRAVDGV